MSLKVKNGMEEVIWKYRKQLQEAKMLGCVRIELWVSEFEKDLVNIEKALLGRADTAGGDR